MWYLTYQGRLGHKHIFFHYRCTAQLFYLLFPLSKDERFYAYRSALWLNGLPLENIMYPRIFSLNLLKHSMSLTVISSILLFHIFSNTWHFCYCKFSSLLFDVAKSTEDRHGLTTTYSKMIYDYENLYIIELQGIVKHVNGGSRNILFCKLYHLPFRKNHKL